MDDFIKRAKNLRGDAGEAWAKSIPETIKTFEDTWRISVDPPFPLSYNYAAPAKTSEGKDVVLKIGFPHDPEFMSEMKAIETFQGNGAVRLLKKDTDYAVMLLERLLPGTPLKIEQDDQKATHIGAKVGKALWIKVDHSEGFIPLEKWYEGFSRYERFDHDKQLLPLDLVTTAKEYFKEMLVTTKENYLIHGDFHHDNILFCGENEWKVIDPKGVIGDPIYDLSVFLYNPFERMKTNVKEMLEKRIEIFVNDLGFEKERIIKWGVAQAILSAIWIIEDNGEDWEKQTVIARALLEIL